MILKELCQERTHLTGEDIAILERYESTLEAVANLVQADAFIDCRDAEGRMFVAAQAAPGGMPSNYKTWVRGLYALPADEPAVHRAFTEGLPFHDIVANTQEHATVRQDVTPIRNGAGEVIGVLIVEYDISRELAMERKLEALSDTWDCRDEQAETLESLSVREAYHRIKNHLQILASFCSIKSRSMPDGEARLQLQEMTGMIRAVASLQSTLAELQQSRARNVTLRPLLEQILRDFEGLLGQGQNVEFVLDCEAFQLQHDTVFHLLIIVNELISNALKHGLSNGGGQISVEVHRGNRFGTVSITDNGGGFPADALQGTGLTIIRTMVEEHLKGEFHIRCDGAGTKAAFSFVL